MTFANIKATGKGSFAYRLMIEGWPEQWVTDKRITASGSADGRTVRTGLSYEGLQLNERIIMREAITQPSGMTFKIATSFGNDGTDYATQSFGVYPEPIARLRISIGHDDTAGLEIDGIALVNDDVYHMGTEAFRAVSFDGDEYTIERDVWDTQPQAHNAVPFDETRSIYIYDRPVTMEGRRAYLYLYDRDDAGSGDGSCIWRGIVSRQPKLNDDCMSWTIDALPITHALRQTLGGRFADTHPIGIYHHAFCAFGFKVGYDGTYTDVYHYPTLGEGDVPIDSEATLVAEIDARFVTALGDSGADAEIDFVGLTRNANGGWSLFCRTGTVTNKFEMIGGSPIVGQFHTGMLTPWADVDGNVRDGMNDLLASNTDYYAELRQFNDEWKVPGDQWTYSENGAAPIGDASIMYAARAPSNEPQAFFRNAPTSAYTDEFPSNRVYVNNDLADAVGLSAYFSDVLGGGRTFKITGSGVTSKTQNGSTANYHYITIEVPIDISHSGINDRGWNQYAMAKGFWGIITADSQISPLRHYTVGSVAAFATSITDESVNANDGDTPFITTQDLATWTLTGDSFGFDQLFRKYDFARELTAEAVLAEELKFVAHCMRIESDGRIGIIPLPLISETVPVDDEHTIAGRDIITPAAGFGMWPGAEPQRDGILTTVVIQDGYNPVEGDWGNDPQIFQDANAIATHKTRGKSKMEIKPYSRAVGRFTVLNRGFRPVAERYLSFFARDYTVVTIKVPYTKLGVLCGDAVSLTHQLIPAGDGTRGIVSRRGVVIERRWNLDPKVQDHGTLVIWVQASPVYGYTASGFITEATEGATDYWAIWCAPANDLNVNLSTNGDGLVLKHFEVGQAVRLVQQNDDTPTIVTGTVADINADVGVIDVEVDSTWTHGFSGAGGTLWVAGDTEWQIEFPTFATADSQQKKYAYVAADDYLLPDDSFARRFA